MGSTNKTNIGLSQFVASDEPTWLSDYNTDMKTITDHIDTLHNQTATVIAGRLNLLDGQVATLTDSVHQNTSDIAVNTSSIAANRVLIDNNNTHLDAVDAREQGHYDTLSKQVDGQIESLEEFREKQTYFEQNMNKTEAEVTLLTASVAANKLSIENVSRETYQNSADIATMGGDLHDGLAKVDAMETQVRQNTTNIDSNAKNIAANTSEISSLDSRTTALETKSADIDTNAGNITGLQADVAALQNHAKTEEENVDNLQKVTANIAEGVQVPFGFGENAGGERGWLDKNGSIQEFVTPEEYAGLLGDIASNLAEINKLIAKTSGLMEAVKVPFSLGIADGGAYGYIKNGEFGVTPWVTEDAVKSIVDIKPIEANIQTLSGNVDTLTETATLLEQNVQTLSGSVDALDAGKASNQSVTTLSQTVSGNTDSIVKLEGAIDTLKMDKADKSLIENAGGCVLTTSTNSSGGVVIGGKVGDKFGKISSAPQSTVLHVGYAKGGTHMPDKPTDYYIPFSFGIDENGNYGYIKAGADTVTPFLKFNSLQTAGSLTVSKLKLDQSNCTMNITPLRSGMYLYAEVKPQYCYDSNNTLIILDSYLTETEITHGDIFYGSNIKAFKCSANFDGCRCFYVETGINVSILSVIVRVSDTCLNIV